jgi:hypothetical protein
VQLALAKPSPASGPEIPSHEIWVPERFKHPAGSPTWTLPVVVVPSVYVPLALAVQVPLTLSEPVSVTFLQADGSSPAAPMSRLLLLKFRHDELTFQVPTTSPPQAVTLGQDDPPPPPPVPVVPPLELPPAPDGLLDVGLHAAEIIPNAIAIPRTAD